ncbi:hypothetical protein [Photobacterium nomapromontoriensis]|uniref:hypothetical protein n=1 Tax=Photobacterium nomapromontoriensis TaxID=2910237 RepID=UPI003D10BF8B
MQWNSRIVIGLVLIILVQLIYVYEKQSQYKTVIKTYKENAINQTNLIKSLEEDLIFSDEKYNEAILIANDKNESFIEMNEKVNQLSIKIVDTENLLRKEKIKFNNFVNRYHKELSQELLVERNKLSEKMELYDAELIKLHVKEADLNKKIDDVNSFKMKRDEFDKLYSSSMLVAQNEERINMLMGQFNQLRVDLNVINVCDKDYIHRYNEAKSILSHIRTFIQKYKMNNEFYYYVISNDSVINEQNRRLCITE